MPDRQGEQDVEVVAPRRPCPPRAQERVVEVVQPPEPECHGEQRGAARTPPGGDTEEHPAGPEGGQAQEQHRRQDRPEEVVEPVDGDVRPDRRKQDDAQNQGRQRIRCENTSAAYRSASAVHPVTT